MNEVGRSCDLAGRSCDLAGRSCDLAGRSCDMAGGHVTCVCKSGPGGWIGLSQSVNLRQTP